LDEKSAPLLQHLPTVPTDPIDPQSDTRLDAASGVETEVCASIWKCAAEDLREKIGERTFERWFRHVELDRIDAKAAWVIAPNPIYQLWIEENFKTDLNRSLAVFLKNCPPVSFQVAVPVAGEPSNKPKSKRRKSGGDKTKKLKKGKAEKTKMRQPKGAVDLGKTSSGPVSDSELLRRGRAVGLSERYWMDGYVVGDNNQLSHAAAMAIVEKQTLRYNPLFLYSAPGLGKSHLLHSIGWEILRKNPKARIAFVSGEVFANEFIAALQKHSLVAFRKKYREADVLLLDDIQFLAGKDATQEEFFHTFNTLMDARKQMVLTSDAAPAEIQSLEERLVSRFQWGMSAEILAPQLESRIAILRRKREEWKVDVPDWAIEFVADRIRSNVRLMEGALMRAATVTSLNGEPLDEKTLEEVLVDFCVEEDARDVSLDSILEVTADHYDLQVKDLTGRRRTSRIAGARQVAMWLARELTQYSLKEIGEYYGGRDHGTVLHGARAVIRKCGEDAALRRQTEYLKKSLTRSGGRGGNTAPAKRRKPL